MQIDVPTTNNPRWRTESMLATAWACPLHPVYSFARVSIEPTSNSYYLYFIVALATVKRIGQKRSLGVSTQRELSFGTNGVLIRRVWQKFQ
jgi:hypothetical protein